MNGKITFVALSLALGVLLWSPSSAHAQDKNHGFLQSLATMLSPAHAKPMGGY